jgi:hypothetical protein
VTNLSLHQSAQAGRIVFDIALGEEEIKAVQEAQLYMQYFEKKSFPSDFGYIFQGPPIVSQQMLLKGEIVYNPNVHAVVEIVGLAFTQGMYVCVLSDRY